MGKSIMVLALILFSSWSTALTRPPGPVDLFIYSFCLETNECSFFVKFENKTSYNVELNTNQITKKGINITTVRIFDAEKYSILEREDKDISKALIPLKSPAPRQHRVIQKQDYMLQLPPYGKAEFTIENVDKLYPLDEETLYITKLYLPAVNIFINGKYAGFKTLVSNFSEFEKSDFSAFLENKKE